MGLSNLMARLLANCPSLVAALLARAKRTPYTTIYGADGSVYMERYWLVGPTSRLRWLLPLMRFHIIHREDQDRDPHDHPWEFRSLILDGSYAEERWKVQRFEGGFCFDPRDPLCQPWRHLEGVFTRRQGTSYRMGTGDFHMIVHIFRGPVTTLCILGRKQADWGFLTENGEKVPWRDYMGLPADAPEGAQP
jgi:hypothetical protein